MGVKYVVTEGEPILGGAPTVQSGVPHLLAALGHTGRTVLGRT